LYPSPPAVEVRDRWSLRVELKDEEIAQLYAQGLARGALVWRNGMPEWRPLLVTPELSSLLHRTPIVLRDASDSSLEEEVTLPRPARLPSGLDGDESASERNEELPTVAPTALDVVGPAPAPLRRRAELLGVAALGFALAWFARGGDAPEAPAALPAAAAAAPAQPAERPLLATAALTSTGGIPTVALADLPLLEGSSRLAVATVSRAAAARPRWSAPARASGGGPTRGQLLAALNQVASVASGCGERSGPVRVVIAFAPSGVARSIQVSGEELASPVRRCIIGAASRARVASFEGDPVTVSKTL
jgi:hypothetical protein